MDQINQFAVDREFLDPIAAEIREFMLRFEGWGRAHFQVEQRDDGEIVVCMSWEGSKSLSTYIQLHDDQLILFSTLHGSGFARRWLPLADPKCIDHLESYLRERVEEHLHREED